jgi:outer membrane protein assembly factor BamA
MLGEMFTNLFFFVLDLDQFPTTRLHLLQLLLKRLDFWAPGERWNFALRSQMGGTTALPQQMHFYFGGIDYLRGYPDNYIRSEGYGIFNAEALFTVCEYKYLAVQPFAFVDGIGYLGGATRGGVALSSGLGVLLSIPQLVDSELRLQVALPVQSNPTFALGVSTAQFFSQ